MKAFGEKLLRFVAIKLMSPVLTASMRFETAGVGPTTRPTTPTRQPQGSQGPTGHVVSSQAGKAPGALAHSGASRGQTWFLVSRIRLRGKRLRGVGGKRAMLRFHRS